MRFLTQGCLTLKPLAHVGRNLYRIRPLLGLRVNEETTNMARTDYLFTSESVSEGHPDKVCDRISDAVLDAFLAEEPEARVAAETVARQARAAQPPQARRVDQNQPMYTKPRPSTGGGGSGGGAFGLPMLLGLFGLAWFRRRKEV